MTNKEIFFRLVNTKVKKYFKQLLFALFLSLIVAISTSATAWLLDPAVKKIFVDKDTTMLYLIPIAIIVAFSAKALSLYIARSIVIHVGLNVTRDLQEDLTLSILRSDMSKSEDKHSAKFISHFLYDTGFISHLASTALLSLMKDSLTLIGLTAVMFYQNWRLAIFALFMMPFAVLISRTLGKRMKKITTEAQENTGQLSKFISELLRGAKITKIYQRENFELGKAKQFIFEMMEKYKKMGIVQIRATPIMETLTGLIIAAFIYYSGNMVLNEQIEINNFFSFLVAMMLAYQPIRSLASININLNQGLAAARRIYQVIDSKNEITDRDNAKILKIDHATIEFNNANFAYPASKNHAVKNINIKVNGGNLTALVGHSGAGKSTMINLIPRFYDVNSGKISIDNQNIKDVSIESLRKNISLVSQDVILFDDTVSANISYANLSASKEQIKLAANFAAATEFIEKLPNGFDTVIGENGVKLSGGQKQRISIARAILKDAPIILLDEATSSLDTESESQVQNAIINLTKNRTTLVIAHRLSTIMRADQIFVLNNGEVVDSGKHEKLLNTSIIYKNLYNKQLDS